jgi:hypothetical protein
MKTKPQLLTREELLDLEDKYFPGTLGNLLSLGAAHFRQTNRKNGNSRDNGASQSSGKTHRIKNGPGHDQY